MEFGQEIRGYRGSLGEGNYLFRKIQQFKNFYYNYKKSEKYKEMYMAIKWEEDLFGLYIVKSTYNGILKLKNKWLDGSYF